MSPKPASPLLQAWYRWKALRLPWRKRFLIGLDLKGNTYWEFRDVRGAEGRWRRIVKYPRSTHHGDVDVSPAWHQWLRHTRKEAPSIEEQQADVVRRERMKYLAAQADAKWAAKPRLVDTDPSTAQPKTALGPGGNLAQAQEGQPGAPQEPMHQEDVANSGSRQDTWRKMQQEAQRSPRSGGADPWKQAQRRRGPSEEWQPQSWAPSPSPKKP
ncbi:hypothetical protein GQ53DRAFT_737842 [Thozetella sp. PMI_491]|nr:hypothetical protein GQ53DRAFT_737842 [Thozetella sp. PMI_491]